MHIELSWESRRHYLSIVPHRFQVMFALFCARQVEDEWKDNKKSVEAVEIVERWLDGKASKKECMTAADAAYAASAVYAAYAAAYAAYAAATDGASAYAAHTAAYACAYASDGASAYAAYTAYAKQEQVEYLRVLYLESLPEEQRNNWLVQTCL